MNWTEIYYHYRKAKNGLVQTLAWLSVAIGSGMLIFILGMLLVNGIAGINWQLFTQPTLPQGQLGGIANAIVGSIFITVTALLVGAPIGVMAGTYLAEYGGNRKLSNLIRFSNDVLLSSPSIIIGLFVYTVAVAPLQHFSAWSGALALALITIPVVMRTSEDMLLMVPNSLREAAAALGATRWRVIVFICYRAAKKGIINGILLAIARISGETAPLIFTALGNQNWSFNFNQPIAALPIVIYNYARSPYEDQIKMAWSGALLITVMILILNSCAKFWGGRSQK